MRTLIALLILTMVAAAQEPPRERFPTPKVGMYSFQHEADLILFNKLIFAKDTSATERFIILKQQAREVREIEGGEEIYPLLFSAESFPMRACYKLRGEPTCTWSTRILLPQEKVRSR